MILRLDLSSQYLRLSIVGVVILLGCFVAFPSQRLFWMSHSILAWCVGLLPFLAMVMLVTRRWGWPWTGCVVYLFAVSSILLLLPSGGWSGQWNWQGKVLSTAFGLMCLARLGMWREAGVTAPLRPGWWKLFLPMTLLFGGLRWFFTQIPTPPTWETIAFQATMPGLEEELWYRGILLCFLIRAFGPGKEWLGLRWNGAMVLTTMLFALVHVIEVDQRSGSVVMHYRRGTTLVLGLAMWAIRERSGSIWPAVAFHNIFNTAGYLNSGWPAE
ncbi:MAG: lysostaphin resistance A-like protein [Fimbriiglobus sp.]